MTSATGLSEGRLVGLSDGERLGDFVGFLVGLSDGECDGDRVGGFVGFLVGLLDGECDGERVGTFVGPLDGEGVVSFVVGFEYCSIAIT
jgi:hypothetical protein